MTNPNQEYIEITKPRKSIRNSNTTLLNTKNNNRNDNRNKKDLITALLFKNPLNPSYEDSNTTNIYKLF